MEKPSISFAAKRPAANAIAETTQTAGKISNGVVEPYCARNVPIKVGMSCSDAVFKTTNITIELFATLEPWFCAAISFIAANPIGVAAFPNPKRFAVMFMQIAFAAGLSGGYAGNSRRSTGPNTWDRMAVRPPASAIFIRPVQAHIMPSIPKINCTAFPAPASTASDNCCIRPVAQAHKTLTAIIAAHTLFSILSPSTHRVLFQSVFEFNNV